MNRHGLTLLELLLSLALLSSLTLASVGWTTQSVRISQMIDARSRWEAAAREALDLIGEDLVSGDLTRRHVNSEGLPDWLKTGASELAIEVRAAPFTADVLATYALDRDGSQLVRAQRSEGEAMKSSRVILGSVAAFETRLCQPVAETETPACLEIRVLSHSGWTAARVYWIHDWRQP